MHRGGTVSRAAEAEKLPLHDWKPRTGHALPSQESSHAAPEEDSNGPGKREQRGRHVARVSGDPEEHSSIFLQISDGNLHGVERADAGAGATASSNKAPVAHLDIEVGLRPIH